MERPGQSWRSPAVLAVAAGCGKSADTVTARIDGGRRRAGATTAAPAPTNERQIATPAPTGDYDEAAGLGRLPRDQLARPDLRVRLPREHGAVQHVRGAPQQQQPDGSIKDGLGTIATPDPTTYVITLKDGVKFWDGTPMTADDVVYSLGRARDPKLGGFYPQVFTRVKDIKATGPLEVTITLTEPDYWLRGELSGPAGVVVEKAYVEAKGQKYGTVDGGAMCTGPFKLDSWKTGEGVTLVKNDAYWNPSKGAHISKVTFKGYPDDAAVTAAFQTGELSGYYPLQLTTLDQLKAVVRGEGLPGPVDRLRRDDRVELQGRAR